MIFFRADGGIEVGMGHLVRCFSLAKMLATNFEITFCCKQAPPHFIENIKADGFLYYDLAQDNDLLKLISEKDIVVLDSYQLNIEYHVSIRNKGSKLVCIDDIHDKPFDADLIINHAPNIDSQNYQAKPYTKFALGPDYALLRPAFLKAAKQKREIKKTSSLIICFGGADPKNYSTKVLKMLKNNLHWKHISIVLGSSFFFQNEIEQMILGLSHVEIKNNLDEEQMARLMMSADVCIVPSSGILFEALACQIIPVSGYYIENQKNIYDGFVNMNAIIPANNFENISEILSGLYQGMIPLLNNPIDGKSDIRILSLFKELAA